VANHSMNGNSVVRFTPPAIITPQQEDQLLMALDQATRDLVKHGARMPEGGH
jgi:putrescine aminotransferase